MTVQAYKHTSYCIIMKRISMTKKMGNCQDVNYHDIKKYISSIYSAKKERKDNPNSRAIVLMSLNLTNHLLPTNEEQLVFFPLILFFFTSSYHLCHA